MSTVHNYNAKADRGSGLDRLRATLALDAPVSSVRQVSAQRASVLNRAMGIRTVRDLLFTFPIRYLDLSRVSTAQGAEIGSSCTIVGSVHEVKVKHPRPRLSIVEIALVDDTGLIMVTCFNQPWLADILKPGTRVSVAGTVEFSYGFKRITNPLIEKTDDGEDAGRVIALHPATSKLSRTMMRRLVNNALVDVRGLYDPLPLALRLRYRLYSRTEALRGIHEPVSMADAEAARRRLRYEELLFLELQLLLQERDRAAAYPPFVHKVEGGKVDALRSALPFPLTSDQQKAISEVFAGMKAPAPLSHLILGDVGTGKTVVAAFACAAAVNSGYQVLMMGPTEVLVRQYGQALSSLFEAAGIRWVVLTSTTSTAERSDILKRFSSGALDILFGTTALLEDAVQPRCASLLVIDEQQRFGVDQREKLLSKAPGADVLSLTATPIPRSLALARYGGLTLSYLHEAPAHQGGRTTHVCHFSAEGEAYDALRAALARGEQAYVVCPLVGVDVSEDERRESAEPGSIEYAAIEWRLEHDEVGDTLAAAKVRVKVLQEQIIPQARVGLMHGRLSGKEKDEVMRRFREGDIDVLVTTTVIEVGVDVPNATVMIIEDADRFGLAQLHQLRGRVGRGKAHGEVFLVSRSKAPEALERLHAMEQTEDGFALSEIDLAQRREGDIFGDRQHGRSPLRLVNVVRDQAVIEAAYRDARLVLEPGALSEAERTALLSEARAVEEARKR